MHLESTEEPGLEIVGLAQEALRHHQQVLEPLGWSDPELVLPHRHFTVSLADLLDGVALKDAAELAAWGFIVSGNGPTEGKVLGEVRVDERHPPQIGISADRAQLLADGLKDASLSETAPFALVTFPPLLLRALWLDGAGDGWLIPVDLRTLERGKPCPAAEVLSSWRERVSALHQPLA
jgi:hypothetical protein